MQRKQSMQEMVQQQATPVFCLLVQCDVLLSFCGQLTSIFLWIHTHTYWFILYLFKLWCGGQVDKSFYGNVIKCWRKKTNFVTTKYFFMLLFDNCLPLPMIETNPWCVIFFTINCGNSFMSPDVLIRSVGTSSKTCKKALEKVLKKKCTFTFTQRQYCFVIGWL